MERRRRIVRAAAWGAAAATAAAAGLAPGVTAGAASGPKGIPVPVRMKEWSITPAPATVPAGTVAFRVRNAGHDLHELVVIRTAKAADALGTGPTVSERGAVGEVENVRTGKVVRTLRLKLAKGHYVLICNLRNHYRRGMRADLTVT